MMVFTHPLKVFRIDGRCSKKPSVLYVDNLLGLTYLDLSRRRIVPAVKISSKVEESVWRELRAIAEESHQNIGGLLTEAIRDYVRRRRVRPEVMKHLEASIAENEELGRLLAQ
jgi:predicted transcriptional regulator